MVIDFWEPLKTKAISNYRIEGVYVAVCTLARTLSNEGGLTIEKQIRKTSV